MRLGERSLAGLILGGLAVATIIPTSRPAAPPGVSFACVNNPCIFGICIDALNSSFRCYCVDGYTGVHCQTNWDDCWSSPCLNGATCRDGIASFKCHCPEGFTGDRCQENIDECMSNPCLNEGTCVDKDNGFVCQCLPGYMGDRCELDMAVCNTTEEAKCLHGGLCNEGLGDAFTCQCTPGWIGNLCEEQVDECASSPCLNGAICLDMHANYVCACPNGFTGKNCEVRIVACGDNNPCQNGAMCVREGGRPVCYCVPDYHGHHCQLRYNECLIGPGCLNGGTCIDGVDSYSCSCPAGKTGRYCECTITEEGTECMILANTTTSYPSTTLSYSSTESSSTPYYSYEPYSSTISGGSMDSTHVTHYELTTLVYSTPETEGSTTEDEHEQETTVWTTFEPSTTTEEIADKTTEMLASSTSSTTYDQTTESTTEDQTYTTESYETEASPTTTESHWMQTTTMELTEITTTTECPKEIQTESSQEVTTSTTTTTTSAVLPLDCMQGPCKNGGTCYLSKQGPKCQCPFGWGGKRCEIRGGIKVAALTGQSYLVHSVANASQQAGSVTVTLRLRTLADTGLILYTRPSRNMYMAAYLQDSKLMFQFSCGLQTMLITEIKSPVNTGYPLYLSATIEYLREGLNEGRCPATLKVNESLVMSGEQTSGGRSGLYKAGSGLLYLGGLPPHLYHQIDLPVKTGITACVNSLHVDGEYHDIYGDAIDGHQISECSSLACLSSPCLNGATCIELAHSWNCLCPNGYVGNNCEQSVCKNNPCQYGGTCMEFPGSGFICLCPLGKHGLYCNQDLEIGEGHYSGGVGGLSSFAAYPLPVAIHSSFELKFRFVPATMDQIALMIFIGQTHPHDSSSDHLAVSFIRGYIVLTWNLGSGPRRIFTPGEIQHTGKTNEVHTVRLGRVGREGWLQVDNLPNVTGTSPGWLTQLNTQPLIYIGGHASRNFSGLPHDLPLHQGYTGCLFGVELKAGGLSLPLRRWRDATGRNVGQCSTKHCANSTCHHQGACLDQPATFTCLCQDRWFGPVCSQRFNPCDSTRHKCAFGSTCVPLPDGYECDCPIGQTGKFCDKAEELSDVMLSGKRSYLSLPPASLDVSEASIELELKPTGHRGIVAFTLMSQGYTMTFFSLYLYGGVLELRILPLGGQRRSGEVLTVRSGKVLPMEEWTRIRAGRYGRTVFLSVDGSVNSGTLLPGETLLPPNKPLYIGGVPDLSEMPVGSVSGLPVPLSGCVRRLWINKRAVPLDSQHILHARNVADCDGTACGGDLCYNNGVCTLDSNRSPVCSCPQRYVGERCEKELDCSETGCENDGRCVNTGHLHVHKCICSPGYTGTYCQTEVNMGAAHLSGDGYMMLEYSPLAGIMTAGGPAKRKSALAPPDQAQSAPDQPFTYIAVNFSTAQTDSVILWTTSTKGDRYLGIGMESGLLKVVWDGGSSVLPGTMTADGAWHTVSVSQDLESPDFSIGRDGRSRRELTDRRDPFGRRELSDKVELMDRRKHRFHQRRHALEITRLNETENVQAKTENNYQSSLIIQLDRLQSTPLQLFYPITTNGIFYIGGLPQERVIGDETDGHFYKQFSGCIESISLGDTYNVTDFTKQRGENVGGCYMFYR